MNFNLRDIPSNPGVYFFKNSRDEIIYIGKAKNLRKRVSSYFNKNHDSPKTKILVNNISNFDYMLVDNEVESLLLENKLIKKYKPKYNINLKDSKTYAYIKITNEKVPKIFITRKVNDKGHYFGPYADGRVRNELFNLVVDLFTLVTPKTYSSKSKLYYEIGKAPSKNIEEIDLKKYYRQVERAKKFLSGKNVSQIKKELKEKMKKASNKKEFETALKYKNQFYAIEYLKEKQKVDLVKQYDQDVIVNYVDEQREKILITIFHIGKGVISSKKEYNFDYDRDVFEEFLKMFYSKNIPPKEILVNFEFWEGEEYKTSIENYLWKIKGSKVNLICPKKGEKKRLVDLALKNSAEKTNNFKILEDIKDSLSLPETPYVIECFDMSNLGSQDIVGGMTCWVNGVPDKENYRRFEIKSTKGKQDDFGAMRETVYRRYHRLKYNKDKFPNLIIIDGGKGQLSAACRALKDLDCDIPIISIAKKDEEIFKPDSSKAYNFDNNSQMMLFLRNVRDSVHKYVITYNREKRGIRMREDFKNIEKENKN